MKQAILSVGQLLVIMCGPVALGQTVPQLEIHNPETDPFHPFFGTVYGSVSATGPTDSWVVERSMTLRGEPWLPVAEGAGAGDFGIYSVPGFSTAPQTPSPGAAYDSRLVFIEIYQDNTSLASWNDTSGAEVQTRFLSSELDLSEQGAVPTNFVSLELEGTPPLALSVFATPAPISTAPTPGPVPPEEDFVRTELIANEVALRDALHAPPPPSNITDPSHGYDSYGQARSSFYRLAEYPVPDVDGNGLADHLQGFTDLIITEACYDNQNSLGFATPPVGNEHYDWVEIYNPTSTEIEIENYYLTDNPSDPFRYQIFTGSGFIQPGESLVIFCTGSDADPSEELQAPFRLENDGEPIVLSTFSAVVVDSFPGSSHPDWIGFPTHPLPDISFGRAVVDGQLGFRYFSQPTPGRQTGHPGYADICAEPEFFDVDAAQGQPDDISGGFLDGTLTVGIRHGVFRDHENDGAVILDQGVPVRDSGCQFYYTLNGAEPSAHSNLYTEPFEISRTTVLRVCAIRPGSIGSPSVTRTFLLDGDTLTQTRLPGLPETFDRWHFDPAVVGERHGPSTDTDGIVPAGFEDFDEEPGILSAFRLVPSVAITLPWNALDEMFGGGNTGQDFPASFEWIDPAQPGAYDQENCAVQISGETSAAAPNPKRNLDILFKKRFSRYGRTRWQGPEDGGNPAQSLVFDDSLVHVFDRLLLRNPYTDSFIFEDFADYFPDSYLKETQRATGSFTVRRRWVHVYFNGYYWGIYDIGEHVNPDLFRSHILAQSLPRADLDPETEAYDDIRVINYGQEEIDLDPVAHAHFQAAVFAAQDAAADPQNASKWQILTDLVDIQDYVRFIIVHAIIGHADFDLHQWRGWIHPDDNRMRFILWDGDSPDFYPWDEEFHLRFMQPPTGDREATILHLYLHDWDPSNDTYSVHPDYLAVFESELDALAGTNGVLSQPSLDTRIDNAMLEVRTILSCEAARWGSSTSVTDWKTNLFNPFGTRFENFPTATQTLFDLAEDYELYIAP